MVISLSSWCRNDLRYDNAKEFYVINDLTKLYIPIYICMIKKIRSLHEN